MEIKFDRILESSHKSAFVACRLAIRLLTFGVSNNYLARVDYKSRTLPYRETLP